ncbi:amidase [Coniochaeta sp. 2T2.1]|nr:amidase [Coniochaeta sp. 2T2.1]
MATKQSTNGLPSLRHLTLDQAAAGLQSGSFTSVDLVKAYLARIDEVNQDLKAVLQPPHGIPILVKDNVATSDKSLHASAGSYTLMGAKPRSESSVIRKLRDAGALILGKTNLSEWTNFRGLDISSGWSPRGGQALGIYRPGTSPGGSSSGSAVAAALGLSTLALGTEVGERPLSPIQSGAFTSPRRQDVIGTLTRTVKDAAYVLSIIAGHSGQDERTHKIPSDQIQDYTTFCNDTDLNGVTIGIPRNTFTADAADPVMEAFEAALETLKHAGAKIVDNADFPAAEEFTKSFPAEEYPHRDIGKFLWTQAEVIDVDSDKYRDMAKQEIYSGGEGGILGVMETHGVDVLAVPSSFGIGNDLAAKMGFPVIGVPLGFYPPGTKEQVDSGWPNLVKVSEGLPFSLTFITKSFPDGVLLKVAYAFEQLTDVRHGGPTPFKLPTTELTDVQGKAEKI